MKTSFLSLLIIALLASTAAGYWPSDPQTNAPVCIATANQQLPKIVARDSGSVIIAWEDMRPGINTDLYAQKLDAGGDTLWGPEGRSICTASGWQTAHQMVADDSGGVIIAWRDGRSGVDIYAQRIDTSGFINWQANGMPICTAAENQDVPQIVSDGSGGAIIVWEDARNVFGDIYAQRVDIYGDTLWNYDGMPICTASGSQTEPVIAPDGSGGAIIAWSDWRGSDGDLYAQRVDADGDTLWKLDGLPICSATGDQFSIQIVSDGSGGAITAWLDRRTDSEGDVYAQRVNANGDTLWSADGLPICTAANEQGNLRIVMDGSGGAIIAWRDFRTDSDGDIYAQRVSAGGVVQWTADGLPICTAADYQHDPRLASDGAGGAIIAWSDRRDGSQYDIYAQKIDATGSTFWTSDGKLICSAEGYQTSPEIVLVEASRAVVCWTDERNVDSDIYAQQVNFNGSLGPAPGIVSIQDFPNDQGKQVGLLWDRSFLDEAQYGDITEYSIWRKFPQGSKAAPVGREWSGDRPGSSEGRTYRQTEQIDNTGSIKTDYWEYLGSVDAHYLEGYAYSAATFEDSSAGGIPYCSFFVSAHTDSPGVFFDSAVDSGYSVDDISPAKTVMTIAHGGAESAKGSLDLAWQQVSTGEDGSPETGPIQYNIYCDTTAWFTPGPGNLLTTTPDLTYAHSDARIGSSTVNLYYLVTAIDGSGNRSEASNRAGEYDYDLKTTTGTDYAWTVFCLGDSTIVMASDLEAYIEAHSSPATNCLSISSWNPVAQGYTSYTTVPIPMGDFALVPGAAYRIEVTADAVWTLVGDVPATDAVGFDLKTTTGTDYTWASVPLQLDSLTMASDLEAHIQAHSDPVTDCLSISEWNPVAQGYTSYTTIPIPMGDFAIRAGRAYRVEVTADAQWPHTAKGAREFQRVLQSR